MNARHASITAGISRKSSDLDGLRAELLDRIETLATSLLGEPNKAISSRRQLRWGSGGSFALEVAGQKRGIWIDHESGEGGDPLALIRHTKRCNFPETITWAKAWIGQPEAERPCRLHRASDHEISNNIPRRIKRAQDLWGAAEPLCGTLAERYLIETRGIAEPASGWPDDAVRYHRPTRSVILAATTATGAVQAVQVVRLTGDAQNARREDGKKIKLTYGVLDGAAVRLPGHNSGPLQISEGPENGLSAWLASGHETWITFGRMGRLREDLPAGRVIVICADDDRPDQPAAKSLIQSIEQWQHEGRKIAIARPWATSRGDKSDFNDVMRAQGPEAVRKRILTAVLELHGLAPAEPPFALPTATIADARAALLRFAQEAFTPAAEGRPAPQILIGGEGGTGKTFAIGAYTPHAMIQAKKAQRPYRLVYMVPEHINLGPQITERFTRLGLNVFRLEGRGDPFKPNPNRKPRCQNLPAVGEAILSGQSVREAVCGPAKDGSCCAFFDACNKDGHFADLRRAGEADVVIVAHNFAFESMPKEVLHDVGWVVLDEDFCGHGDYIPSLTVETFGPEAHARFPVLHKGEPDADATSKLALLHAELTRVITAVEDGYLPASAIRAEGLTLEDCVEASRLNWRRKIDPGTTPKTDLQTRGERRREVAINRQLSAISAIWHGVGSVLRDGEEGAGRIALTTEHRAKGSWREITAYAQKHIATWLTDLPIIIAGATTGLENVRRFFPRAVLRSPPRVAALHTYTRLVLGGFGKSTLARRPKRLQQLRTWLAVENIGRDQGVVTHQLAVAAFDGIPKTRIVHHGANAGDDSFRDVDVMSVIGGMSGPPAIIAQLAAARSGRAVPYARAIETTGAVLMRDGTGVAVPVLAYEDPDAQAVHRGIYNGSIEQAAARARQVDRTSANPVEVNIFANVAPAMPIDEIVHWRDIRPDRLWDMIAAGRIYENAAQMHAVYPDLFRTARAAADARARMGDIRARTREAVGRDGAAWSEIAFQPAGQGHHVSRGWCRTRDVEAARADIELRLGELVYWRAFAFTEGREVVRRPVYEDKTGLRITSRPAADLERGVLAEYAKQGDQQPAAVFQTPDG